MSQPNKFDLDISEELKNKFHAFYFWFAKSPDITFSIKEKIFIDEIADFFYKNRGLSNKQKDCLNDLIDKHENRIAKREEYLNKIPKINGTRTTT